MSDIDYSQFRYKRKATDSYAVAPALAKPKRRKWGKVPLILIVVLLCFGILFLSIDFFTNGYLIDSISASLKGNSYNYYMVVMDRPGRELSYAQSLLVKQSGGSGYIISDDGFKVVYSVFADKSQANVVSEKNSGTYIYRCSITSKDTLLFNKLDAIVRELISYTVMLEKGQISESEFLAMTNAESKKLLSIKESYQKDNKIKEQNLIDFVVETLCSFNLSTELKMEMLSDIRYATVNIVVAMSFCVNEK